MLTKDLSVGLQVGLAEAERIKLHFGISPKSSTDSIDVIDLHGKTKKLHGRWFLQSLALG